MTTAPDWLTVPLASLDESARSAAEAHQKKLTKPAGSLGYLETVATRLAALQGTAHPHAERVHIAVFAGDHGIAAEGVSAFPQSVTGEMVRNFARGGAAINVLARQLGATLHIVDLGTVNDPGPLSGVETCRLGPGTANFSREPAMSEDQLARALNAGQRAALRARAAHADLFIGGEMGIGNTTAATTLACALLNTPAQTLAGPGTGLDSVGVAHKIDVIRRALALHGAHFTSPLETLRRVGGFEIAALVGSYIACAQIGLPVLIDGFISSSAALAAAKLASGIENHLLYSHMSGEPGHRAILAALGARPLLDLGMRLGEGSGAAVSVPLIRIACALHNNMATFADAGVAEKSL